MRKICVAIGLLSIVLSLCLLSSCEDDKSYEFYDSSHFGSIIRAYVFCDDITYKEFSKKANTVLDDVSNALDAYLSTSDIARFNNADSGTEIEISKITAEAFRTAKEAYILTNGCYDATIANLVDLWGFSSRFYNANYEKTMPYDRQRNEDGSLPLPDEKYISIFSLQCDFSKVALIEKEKLYLKKGIVDVSVDSETYLGKLDFGGLAKGLVISKIQAICQELNITRGYISFGKSSLYLLGNKKDEEWELVLTDPRNTQEGYLRVMMKNQSISTTGDYERFYTLNGKRYSHIIDKNTGKPVDNGVYSVTVIGAEPVLGDCLSTGLMAMGKEEIISFAKGSYAMENDIKIIATFEDGEELSVFSTQENIKLEKGTMYAG